MVWTGSTNFRVNLIIAAAAQSWSDRFGEGLVKFSVNQKDKWIDGYFIWQQILVFGLVCLGKMLPNFIMANHNDLNMKKSSDLSGSVWQVGMIFLVLELLGAMHFDEVFLFILVFMHWKSVQVYTCVHEPYVEASLLSLNKRRSGHTLLFVYVQAWICLL